MVTCMTASDSAGLSASLRLLLSDTSALRRAREKSLQLAEKFDIRRVVDAYENLLKEACA